MAKRVDLIAVYEAMRGHFGHREWWPGDTQLEIILGAILTQNTNWKNVEKALANLKSARALSIHALRTTPPDELAQLIRPSGYYNQKALKIKAFIVFLDRDYGGSLEQMFREETGVLREKLLSVKGIGPETADSILLYAGGRLSFVVDLYTYRILTRHGWLPEETTYDEMKAFFEDALPQDVALYNDYHAQLVAVGHHFCRKSPQCEACPLQPFLP